MKEKDLLAAKVFSVGLILGLPVYVSGFLAGGVMTGLQFGLMTYACFTIAALVVKY